MTLRLFHLSLHQKSFPDIALYPAYHSVYDTFHLVETYYDPDFVYHLAGAQLFGELLRDFADSVLLPMDCVYYAAEVQKYLTAFREGSNGMRILKEGLSLGT